MSDLPGQQTLTNKHRKAGVAEKLFVQIMRTTGPTFARARFIARYIVRLRYFDGKVENAATRAGYCVAM